MIGASLHSPHPDAFINLEQVKSTLGPHDLFPSPQNPILDTPYKTFPSQLASLINEKRKNPTVFFFILSPIKTTFDSLPSTLIDRF